MWNNYEDTQVLQKETAISKIEELLGRKDLLDRLSTITGGNS